MEKEVVLTILGAHRDTEGDNGSVETVAEGEYFLRGGAHYVLFEENVGQDESKSKDGNESRGSDSGNKKSRIKIKGNVIELIRQGNVGTHMIFEKNKKHETLYQTPYGQMYLGIDTRFLRVTEEEDRIRAAVEYVLEAEGQYLSDSRIEITIQNKKHRTG